MPSSPRQKLFVYDSGDDVSSCLNRRKVVRSDSGCTSVTSHAVDSSYAQLVEEVDRLAKKHRMELTECMERWQQCAPDLVPGHLPLAHPKPPPMVSFANCVPPQVSPEQEQAMRLQAPAAAQAKLSPANSNGTLKSVIGMDKAMDLAMDMAFFHAPSDDKTVREVASGDRKRSRKTKQKVADELLAAGDKQFYSSRTWLQRLTGSRQYEASSGLLILLNAIFIGWEAQYQAQRADDLAKSGQPLDAATPPSFLVLQVVFSVLFAVELGLRWVCEGLVPFFQDSDRWWNILDVSVVAFSIIDLLMTAAVEQSDVLGSISVFRILRVVRVVRVAKVIRIMRFFRELRMMIFSILRSMKSLLWVVLVLSMTFYVFGITFTVATTTSLDTAAQWTDPATEGLRRSFGTLDRSFLSLFMAMSGGRDWGMYYSYLEHLPVQYSVLFLLYISFALFAVVNIVTGVFVESALQSNAQDKDITVHEELEAKKNYLRSMREIFDAMDDNDSGSVSLKEFEAKLADERIIAYFNALKLDVSDARRLFWLIDKDKSEEVDIDEFLSGCYELQGESRALDTKLMQHEVRSLHANFGSMLEALDKIQGYLCDLQVGKLS